MIYEGVPWYVITLITFIFVLLLVLSRAGFHLVSSYILIIVYFATVTYSLYIWGSDLPTALLSYALLIVTSSILIGTIFGLGVTAVIASMVIVLSYLEGSLIFTPRLQWKNEILGIYDGIAFAAIFSVIMTISWLSNREIERSLKRARRSEAALKVERDSLELRVERRTEELQQLQLQRVTELHHFAELGKLANGFFHDLMNPLTALTLAVEQFGTTQVSSKSRVTEQLDKALTASRRVGELIVALRHYGTMTTEPQVLSINTELRRITNLLEYSAKKQQVRLELQSTLDLTLSTNPYVFYNIVHNLIAFSIEQAHNFPTTLDEVIIILLHQKKQQIVLEVIYPSDRLPTLTPTTNLELTITKNLLDKLKGDLQIKQSKKDHIIVITIVFPS